MAIDDLVLSTNLESDAYCPSAYHQSLCVGASSDRRKSGSHKIAEKF